MDNCRIEQGIYKMNKKSKSEKKTYLNMHKHIPCLGSMDMKQQYMKKFAVTQGGLFDPK